MLRGILNHWTAKVAWLLPLVAVLLLGLFSGPTQTYANQILHPSPVLTDFNTTLQPGVWHGFVLSPASVKRGYVAEISPLQPSIDGAHIERYVVQPEFNETQWNDVLRVQIPLDNPALEVNIRVYSIERR
jgi:hypothetical protein